MSAKKPQIKKHNTRFEKDLSVGQRRYLERQAGDPYVQKARDEGYRSRAAFKLLDIQAKYKLIKPGMVVVDLGAAPGGWCQVLARHFKDKITILALDKIPIDDIGGVTFIEGDFQEAKVEKQLAALCPKGVDVVLSDMAPETSGQSATDHLRIMNLVELAAEFARDHLRPGGHFACKIFMGGQEKAFTDALRKDFEKVGFYKPPSSRKESREIFIIAQNFFRQG